MKKLFSAAVVLCTALFSCDSLDLSNIGYGDGDRLKPSTVKAVLYAPDGCWTTSYADYNFYFQFNEDGTVIMDSEQMKDPTTSAISFATSGRQTELTIEGGGHFAFLGSGLSETTFIISEASETRIVCKGENTGSEFILLPTTKAVMEANASQKVDFLEKIREYASLTPGVISYGNDQFVAYYTTYVDYMNLEVGIRVITIEKENDNDAYGHTKVYTSNLKKEGNKFILETPIPEFKTMTTGDRCSMSSIEINNGTAIVSGVNSGNLTVTSNDEAVTTFDNIDTKWACAKESVHGTKGAACQEIWDETSSLIECSTGNISSASIEVFASYGDDNMKRSRPLVFWVQNSNGFSTLAFPGSNPSESIMKNDERDRIVFTKISSSGIVGWGGFNDAEIEAVNAKFTNLLKFWFEEEGLYVAMYQGYIYLLSPTSGMWMKCQKS
ncbi:MAG: DUF4302 domain-containing protein [Bacteroides sp.]|nr:DUF4302 domain-containing protein [Bacteroides sp.]